jgi:hypothetical protein
LYDLPHEYCLRHREDKKAGGTEMARLIDANALCRVLNDHWLATSPSDRDTAEVAAERAAMCRGLDDAMRIVEQMPTVATDINVPCKWISVNDRLPGTDDEVLTTYLYDDKPNKRYVESASYFDDGEGEGHWHSVWDEFSIGRVWKTTIAWMPMPKPYKPSKED